MSRFKLRWPRIAFAALAATVAFASGSAPAATEQALEIAVLGPMSGNYAGSGQAMVDGARLQAERINAQGGIGGRHVEIVSYDTQSDPGRGRKLAARIAASDAVAAVGAYFSSVSVEAAPVFNAQGMPAITGSATAPGLIENNPWYFRVVPDNGVQGRFIALYTDGVLHEKTVDIVYEDDAYGKTLYQAYARTARQLGMKVAGAWPVDSARGDAGARLDTIVARLKNRPQPGALFVALLGEDSAQLVKRLRQARVDTTIVGGDSVGLESFRRTFDSFQHPGRTKAQYMEGIYATTYFLRDVANQRAQRFAHAFDKRYGRAPRPLAAPYYDSVGIIAAALKDTPADADTATLRRRVRQGLRGYDSLQTAYKGVTGRLHFDRDGDVVKPSPVGIYAQGRLISAPAQLTPIVHPEAVPNLTKLLDEGAAVSMGGRPYYTTEIVYTGVDINAIRDIDTKAGTFIADFYLWFRHRAPFDPGQVEFINAAQPTRLETRISRMQVAGMTYQAFRVTAPFKADFDFHAFPFDHQALSIRLRHDQLQGDRLRFVTDDIGMRRASDVTPTHRARHQGVLGSSDEWRLADLLVFTDIDTTQSTLGNPRLFRAGADTQISNSRFNVVIDVERLTRSYVFDNVAPLFFVLMLGYAMLWVPVDGPAFVARLNLGVIALLTTVSFSLKTSGELPSVSYLTVLDYLYFVVYTLLLFGIAGSIVKLYWTRHGYDKRLRWLDLTSRILLPALLTAAIVGAVLVYEKWSASPF